jgi:UDP-N-acetylglucosamine transferase subunit ALG13
MPVSAPPPTILLAASQGGHLQELVTLAPRLVPADARQIWMTSPSPQATSLLGGREVIWVRHAAQRDVVNVIRNVGAAARPLGRRGSRPLAAVSTGAAIALSLLPAARAVGVEAHYIESAARTNGPSLTGRLLGAVPGVHRYSQWPAWVDHHWTLTGSVFDGLETRDGPPRSIRRVVVTVGTQSGYRFTRLVRRMVEILPPDAEVLWQVHPADASALRIDARPIVPAGELADAMTRADVVVAHAGIGSLLSALGAGRCPVVVPRELRFGEHVDDHQRLIGDEVGHRGLAVVRSVDELGLADLEVAAGRNVVTGSGARLTIGGRLGHLLGGAPDVAAASPSDEV